MIEIVLDIVLLWHGRWEILHSNRKDRREYFQHRPAFSAPSRSNGLANQMGASDFVVEQFQFTNTPGGFQLIGMASFRLAFFVALIVITVDTIIRIYRLVRNSLSDVSTPDIKMESTLP